MSADRKELRYLCDNMRHLVCLPYSISNLHIMANELNINHCWFDKDHYDIPKRRIDEIRSVCEIVSPKIIARIARKGASNATKDL